MKCCDITSNMLNRQITIERRTQDVDGMGGQSEDWTFYASVWASVKPVGARERAYAGRIEAQADFKAIVRFRGDANSNPEYTADDRVEFQGKTYGLEYVTDIDNERAWLELGLRAAK